MKKRLLHDKIAGNAAFPVKEANVLAVFTKIKRRFYQDSLKLMRVSAEIKDLPDIRQAFAFMATEINKKTRMRLELMDDEARAAGGDDLVLLVECDNELAGRSALDEFEKRVTASVPAAAPREDGEYGEAAPATFEQAKTRLDANLAVISVPGTYAAVQAMAALSQGMNVMLFSDNVSVEDEIALKDYAASRDLLVMGPDCGTAIIGGAPLCFANAVRPGKIGVIGASGTGTQEFTTLLDSAGCGITHAIGTGGRDLSEEVAGRAALTALKLLAVDANTEIIAIVSKPPSAEVAEKVVAAARAAGKPAVLAFLGAAAAKGADNIYIAPTIEEAAAKAVALCDGGNPDEAKVIHKRSSIEHILTETTKLSPEQKRVKGLYTGGTLASEAKYILKGLDADIIDLGDDEYTRGALHPMIDPSSRGGHIMDAFENREVAAILCDVVLGYGSHSDPAGELVRAIQAAREKTGSHKIVIASVTGTENDPQVKSRQVKKLEEARVYVLPSNQYAAEAAATIVKAARGVK